MLIIFIIIFIILWVIGIKKDNEFIFIPSMALTFLTLFIYLILFIQISSENVLDNRIILYKENNTLIESKIDIVIKEYLKHENKTYNDLKSKDSISIILSCPNLASNELIKQEIETYKENNKKILELKEAKTFIPLEKWWLYFGGN